MNPAAPDPGEQDPPPPGLEEIRAETVRQWEDYNARGRAALAALRASTEPAETLESLARQMYQSRTGVRQELLNVEPGEPHLAGVLRESEEIERGFLEFL